MITKKKIKNEKEFRFTPKNKKRVEESIEKYPEGKQASAIMPILYIAQEQCGGFIPEEAIDYIADLLQMPTVKVFEIATSYTMYNIKPVGKYLIQICRTTPCWLCGSNSILNACKEVLKIDLGETTPDDLFTLREVECLGACVNGPVVQINNDYYENLTPEKMKELLLKLKDE